jgi:hypothetical protein
MNSSSSSTSDVVAELLYSLECICRNLSQLLNSLDVDVSSMERLLTQVQLPSSSSSSTIEEDEDFYENLCDEKLEPKSSGATML